MCNSAGYLKAALMNRNITIDSDGIILLFNPKEKGAYNIAAAYKDKMQVIFKRASGTDFAVKVAYENDIQEELIDFWNLPGGNGEVNEPIEVSDDPLDNLVANFGEIVENVDESEFTEYDSSRITSHSHLLTITIAKMMTMLQKNFWKAKNYPLRMIIINFKN